MSNRPEAETPDPEQLGPELAERIGMRVDTTTEHRYFFGIEREHNAPFEVPGPQQGASVKIHIPPSPPILVEDGSRYPELQAYTVLRQILPGASAEEGWLPLGGIFDSEGSIRDGSLRLHDFDGDLHVVAEAGIIELERERTYSLVVTVRQPQLAS